MRVPFILEHPAIPPKWTSKFLNVKFAHLKLRYTGCIKKKLNKPEIALRLCKAPQCTKFFIEIGHLGADNVL